MKKKRIISLAILAAVMTQMCTFGNVLADENEEKSIEVLQKTGIVTGEDIENPSQAVTRAKFTYYAAKALGLINVEDKLYFKDLPTEHWANPHVSALLELGVIDLSYDNCFNPDAPVTPEQAYKIMLVGLGYKKSDNMKDYITSAANLGIMVKTNNTGTLTFNEAAEIIYNAMNAGAPRLIGAGEDFTQENLEKNTLMTLHDLAETEGVITAVYGASLNDETEILKENIIHIDGEEYYIDSNIDVNNLLGRYVEFVYQESDDDFGKIIYVKADEDDATEISSELIYGFDANTYELKYYKNEQTTKASSLRFDDGVKVIYNGKLYSGRLSEIIDAFVSGERHGKISYIEASKGHGDLVVIKSYRTVMAKAYSDKDEVYFDYYSPTDNLDIKNADIIRYVNQDGTKANAPTAFMVALDVAESQDGKTVEIVVCDKQVRGTLNSLYAEEDAEFEIDGNFYKISDAAWNKFGQSMKIGSSVNVWLDSMGNIVYLETSKESGLRPGYLMEVRFTDDDVEGKYMFKIFADGKMEKYPLAERVELDGNFFKMENPKDFFMKFPLVTEFSTEKVSVEAQVIRFELNNDGEIAKIDTTALGNNEIDGKSLKLVHNGGNDSSKTLIYTSTLKRFGMNYMYDSAYTDVFVLPQGVSDGKVDISGNLVSVDDSMYTASATFEHLTSHSLDIYDYDDDNPLSEIIVAQKKPLVNEQNIYMFKGMSKVLDADGEASDALKCYCASGEKTILLDDSLTNEASKLKKGDIIIIDTDLQGKKAYKIEKYFSGKDAAFYDGENRNTSNPYWYRGTYNPYGDSFIITARVKVRNVTKGYAFDIKNNVLEVMYEQDKNVSERINTANVPVIVYDKNEPKNEIYKGTLSDIDTYNTTGNADMVLVGYYNENAKCIFVYK